MEFRTFGTSLKMDNYQEHLYKTNNLIIKYLVGLRIKNILNCLDKKDNVLEAGCGDGYLLNKIAQKVNSLTCIDINQNRIKTAKKLANRSTITFLKEDITTMTLNKTFDKIICSEVLEHIFNYKLAIKNLSYHLNFNGELIITTPNEIILEYGRILLFGKRKANLMRIKTNHLHKISYDNIKKISNDLDLKIIKYKPLPLPILNLNKLFVLRKLI